MQSSSPCQSQRDCEGEMNIIPSCFDCVLQPERGIEYESFFCNFKQKRHWIHTGVCEFFIPDYGSYAELVSRYPEMAND